MIVSTSAALTLALPWLKDMFNEWLKDKKAQGATKRDWSSLTHNVIRQTQAMADRFSTLTTVAFPNEPVKLASIYQPLTLAEKQGEKYKISSFPKGLFAEKSKLLVVDSAGMGKSTLARVLYTWALEERQILPVLIDLRRVNRSVGIDSALHSQFGVSSKLKVLFSDFLRTQPILFLFDGFDEVAETEKLDVARNIRDFVDQCLRAHFFITSRPELHFSNFTDFTHFSIQPLTKVESYALISAYGVAYGIEDGAKALQSELKNKHDEAVNSFLSNPLLTSLLFRAFEYKSIIPMKRGVFYRQVFDALYESHDLNKETGYVREKRTGLHQDDFHRVLRAMASQFRKKRVTEIQQQEFLEYARSVSQTSCLDLSFKAEDLLNDATSAVPVFTKDGSFIRWSHKSLLDYFVAEFLLRDYAKSKEEALQHVAMDGESFSSQNFLALILEADPTLFASAVTIPAINEALARYDQMISIVPDYVEEGLRDDIATFFMCYEVFLSNLDGQASVAEFVADANAHGIAPNEYLLTMLWPHAAGKNTISLYMHRSFAALQVPLQHGGVPGLSKRLVMEAGSNSPQNITANRGHSFAYFTSYIKEGKAPHLDDDFKEIAAHLGGTMTLPEAPSLREARDRLTKLVANAVAARSDDIF